MKKNRIVAPFLALAMMLSMVASAAGTISVNKDANVAEEVKAAAEAVLSASAKSMWLYEDHDLVVGTIEELAAPARLTDSLSTLGVKAEEIATYTADISFFQEKTKYFKTMREEQGIQRNDFKLQYSYGEAEISGNRASLYVVESISFHYPKFPDILSEVTNYYDVELIRVDGKWLVAALISEGDDFDQAYKGTGFTAANAEECFKAKTAQVEARSAKEIAEEYGFTLETEADAANATAVYYNYDADNATAYAYTYVSQSSSDTNPRTEFYNKNFKDFAGAGGDCQNYASQCVWAGFNGSNSLDQIYNTVTGEHSPIMDTVGSLVWYGTVPSASENTKTATWTAPYWFYEYVTKEQSATAPDMIASISSTATDNFSSVYSNLEGAVLITPDKGHAIVVTDVRGPGYDEILFCSHTSDCKALSLQDRYVINGVKTKFYYVVPQKMRISNPPVVKINANLERPIPVGTTLTIEGIMSATCGIISMEVQTPSGKTRPFKALNTNSISGTYTFDEPNPNKDKYTITITARKDGATAPVVYVYTIRTY